MFPFLFSSQISAIITLILMLNHTSPHHNPLLDLLFEPASNPDDFLPEIPWFFILWAVSSITQQCVAIVAATV